jgi:uncharacterized delta-60 repeat protein
VNAAGAIAAVLLAAGGALDPTFDGDGKLLTDFGGRDSAAHAVAVQPDGKIVAAGRAGGDFALARYRSDGRLDRTFGGDGIVVRRAPPHWTGGQVTTDLGGTEDRWALAVQPDGRVVVAGHSGPDFALARYRG